ncbi:MAG: rod shape-determining protein MreC [Clostridia bacterium]
MRDILKNHLILILIIATILIGSTIIYTTNSNDFISEVVHTIFRPIQSLFTSITEFVSNTFQDIDDFGDVQKERDDLSRQVSLLKVSQVLLDEARLEINHLHNILNYSEELENFETSYAKVLTRDPNNWFNSLTIDIGEIDGVVEGMTVIAVQEYDLGLIGVIDTTTRNTSTVHLLIDPSKNIAAAAKTSGTILGEEEEAIFDGIIEGSVSELGLLKMIYISHEATIEENTKVITTGLGGFYVPDIPIGTIKSLERDAYGLLQTATVKPFIDFTRIKDVLVVKSPLPENMERDQDE